MMLVFSVSFIVTLADLGLTFCGTYSNFILRVPLSLSLLTPLRASSGIRFVCESINVGKQLTHNIAYYKLHSCFKSSLVTTDEQGCIFY